MLRTVNWLARVLGYAWLGVLLDAGRRDNQWIVTAELPRFQPGNGTP